MFLSFSYLFFLWSTGHSARGAWSFHLSMTSSRGDCTTSRIRLQKPPTSCSGSPEVLQENSGRRDTLGPGVNTRGSFTLFISKEVDAVLADLEVSRIVWTVFKFVSFSKLKGSQTHNLYISCSHQHHQNHPSPYVSLDRRHKLPPKRAHSSFHTHLLQDTRYSFQQGSTHRSMRENSIGFPLRFWMTLAHFSFTFIHRCCIPLFIFLLLVKPLKWS